jgi:hypothetical protein
MRGRFGAGGYATENPKEKITFDLSTDPPYLWRKVQLALPTTEKKEKNRAQLYFGQRIIPWQHII